MNIEIRNIEYRTGEDHRQRFLSGEAAQAEEGRLKPGKRDLRKSNVDKIVPPVHETCAFRLVGGFRELDGGKAGDGDGGVEELHLLPHQPILLLLLYHHSGLLEQEGHSFFDCRA